MPLFVSDEEFCLIAGDSAAVAERADAFIRDVRRQLDGVRAEADAASIAAEQSCSLIEQRYSSLYADFSRLQSENAQLTSSFELRLSEIADAQAEKHQLHLKIIGKDGEIERLSAELTEMRKGKRQLLELVEMKDEEIREKNATIQSYLDKIVNLTESNSSKEARVHEAEAELGRCRAGYNRVTQGKELLERHNAWLNEELTAKVNSLVELRRTHMDVEANLSSKLADHERQLTESSNSLKWSKERSHELELRVNSLEEELCSSKKAAAASEEQFAAELSTVTKLVELYKASSKEWSKKAGELEGVIKALETHLSQTENDYKGKLEKEISARKDLEKEAADLREKLEKCETEIENTRKTNELSLLSLYSLRADVQPEKLSIGENIGAITNVNSDLVGPMVPKGISGTALAASLLRDGWSLAKMYEKYQEAYDAFLHESRGRKELENVLNQVHHMIEEKVEMISDERAEHQRMLEAYNLMDQKLQQTLLEHENLENIIRQLKVELKMRQRDHSIAQKEVGDLQKQVAVLLKECQDVQLRCGGIAQPSAVSSLIKTPVALFDTTDAERVISEHLLTFKDIEGLVEQNVHLRRLVHNFSIQEEKRDTEIREGFQIQLQKVTDEATAKVEAVLKRSEEQSSMIESLHTSVVMYKRLYDEERKIRASANICTEAVSEDGNKELMALFEGGQEVSKKSHEQLSERTRNLEQDLATLRSEILSLRSERDKMSLEANFARERLDSFVKEFDHLRQEANSVSARNVELTNLLVDYQKRLRESSNSLQSSEENSRKFSMEVSILKHEKEILINSEKRSSDEVRSLSERVYRLQSSLDTIQSAEEARENARANERRKHEDYLKRVEREWAEAKKELQEERDHVRTLTLDKEKIIENSLRQVEEMRKELTDALRAVASAESRAAVSEARYADLEMKVNSTDKKKVTVVDGGPEQLVLSTDEVNGELWKTKDDLEILKEEARVNKEYMLQYKEIARINEIALKQLESAYKEYNLEAEKLKKALEDEVQSLRNTVCELESSYKLKSEESTSAIESKEHALSYAMSENLSLREDIAEKLSHIELLELQVSSLKDDVDKEHQRWRTAQDNYERQVVLQSETIQELTNTSKELSVLQPEITKLNKLSEALKTENDLLRKTWEKEKVELQQVKSEAERKYDEVNEQNRILHDRLETFHIRLVGKESTSSGIFTHSTDSQADGDLQNVISYLRRSKEIAETEISLLKQENLRLQSQLESALKASEHAQMVLRSQYENSQTQIFKDDEFKSLQLQVKEINLLRESNVQLRAENKHNFEECQKFHEDAQKTKVEAEKLAGLLREKEIELDACQKEIEMLKVEIGHLNNRVTELCENTRNVDAEEHERMKDELQHVKVLIRERESEVELSKNLISEKLEHILSLEQTLAKCQSDLVEQEKRLNDAFQVEASTKAENEKQKRIISILKKKNETLIREKETLTREMETLTREKEELHYKNQALLKQMDDSKLSRKNMSENSIEQAKKDQEKDTRIQMLERTLERQKEDLKKERDDIKLKRKQSRNTVMELLQKVKEEKTKVEEELAKHKHAIVVILERSGMTAAQLPSGNNLDEQTLAYFQFVGSFEDFANSLNEGDGSQSVTTNLMTVDTSAASLSAQKVISHQTRLSAPQTKAIGEREDRSTASKPSIEARKLGRRIIRPPLERPAEPPPDTKVSDMEPSTTITEDRKSGGSHKLEPAVDTSSSHVPSARKRLASSLSDLREGSAAPEETSSEVLSSLKKSKHSEASVEDSSDVPSIHASFEGHDTVQQLMIPCDISESQSGFTENMETGQTRFLSNDEIIDDEKAEEDVINIREGMEEQQEEPIGGTNLEDEVPYDGDANMEESADKPSTSIEVVDEPLKSGSVKELSSEVESEDEREEGELMPDDLELEDIALGDVQNELITVDGGEIGDEGVDGTEVASPVIQAEKTEEVDTGFEEAAEASDKHDGNNDEDAPGSSQSPQRSMAYNGNDQATPDLDRSPPRSAAAREGSPAYLPQTSVSERQSPSPGPNTVATETDEPEPEPAQARAAGRTISIAERARENARLRQQSQQARINTPIPPKSVRGRALGSVRGARGSRGRGGRG